MSFSWSHFILFLLCAGNSNSIKTRILEPIPAALQQVAVAIWLTAAKHKKETLSNGQIIGFNMEEHQVVFYYYFKSSTKLKDVLTEYLDFVYQEWENFTR